MSSTRDVSAELERTTAGDRGVAVDARCRRCDTATAKRAPEDAVKSDHAFEHYCPECRRTTWWSVLERLEGIDA